MKNGKKPSVKQCNLIKQRKLNPADWLVVKDTPTEMMLVHRHSTKTTRIIPKGGEDYGDSR